MRRPQKEAEVEGLTQQLAASKGTVVVEYRGLNVADMAALRKQLRAQSVELRVAKNTLLRRAATAANLENVDTLFSGPTAVATSVADEIAAAKLLTEAARVPRTPLVIRGGIFNRRGVAAEDVRAIAELPPREVLLARVLGVVQAPAGRALSVVQAPARQVLYALNARREQQEGAA